MERPNITENTVLYIDTGHKDSDPFTVTADGVPIWKCSTALKARRHIAWLYETGSEDFIVLEYTGYGREPVEKKTRASEWIKEQRKWNLL